MPNPDYHDSAFQDAPPIAIRPLVNNRARLNALISGQIDLAEVRPAEAAPALARGFGISAHSNGWLGLTILDRAGELVPELGDARVRQAIGFAVDRQAIADTVFLGYARPAFQPMLPGLGHDPSLEGFFSHDPDRARALLAEAGVDGFSFTVPVLPHNTALYEALQAYLRNVGIDMRIKVIEPGTIEAMARTRGVSGEHHRLSQLRPRQPPPGDLVGDGRVQSVPLRGAAARAARPRGAAQPRPGTARASLPGVLQHRRQAGAVTPPWCMSTTSWCTTRTS